MNKKLLKILVCPMCKGKLVYNKKKKTLSCEIDKLSYPVRDGVPVLLQADSLKN